MLRLVVFVAALAAAAAAWFVLRPAEDARLAACGGGSTMGGGAIGGAFALEAPDGSTVTDADLFDRLTLVYFGYTLCPDFCPLDAAIMADAVDLLAERGIAARAVFVTIDPERDTPERLGAFAAFFHPEMLALGGAPEQVAQAARAFRVYHARVDDDPEFYLMDHSTFTYLVAPGGAFLDFFRHGTAPEVIADRVACFAAALDAPAI
ncbi:MAG: SCO family protein [Rhodobacteraceae bacterium]|nr:MAG: SCO family protein [Paracoccaceae bacterium]